MYKLFYSISLIMILVLSGCSDSRKLAIETAKTRANTNLIALQKALDNKNLLNANILTEYSKVLKSSSPNTEELMNVLALEATSKGNMFQNLSKRLNEANIESNFKTLDEQLAELNNIIDATDQNVFNDALSDPINVIADMSNNTLGRVNTINKNDETSLGKGEQLVGNPAYGQWRTDNSGSSFWAWYGMYSLFNNVMYNDWSYRRGYSYYNDIGRERFSSPKQIANQDQVYTKAKKDFSGKGRIFDNPYAKKKQGSSGLSGKSKKIAANPKANFKSSYSKSSSSFRSSQSNRTRSTRGGK